LGTLTSVVTSLLIGTASVAIAYVAAALLAVYFWNRRQAPSLGHAPPVSVLKPLCGAEPELYENLRSFCDQDYARFEVICGVRSPNDPAIAVVERLRRELPGRDIVLVVDERLVGMNYKASNLSNMLAQARYPYLAISDSDIRVAPDYLARVMGELGEPGVGLVTCLYRARPLPNLWSYLGAIAVDTWFLPSVLVGRALGFASYCFGASMALERGLLERIGGFESLARQLADDYELGARVQAQGLRVKLSSCMVETTVNEPSLRSLLDHELRWARTIRTVQPLGHVLSIVTYAIPISCLAALALGGSPAALVMPAVAVTLRAALHLAVNQDRIGQALLGTPLLPLRGFLSLFVWAASFRSRRVRWRQRELCVEADGQMTQCEDLHPLDRAW
jgi:ceramide glucosyltransferase